MISFTNKMENECTDLWHEYKACVDVSIAREYS